MKGFYKCLNIFVDHRINEKAFDLFFLSKTNVQSAREKHRDKKREIVKPDLVFEQNSDRRLPGTPN